MKILYYLWVFAATALLGGCTSESSETLKLISYNIRLASADDGTNSWEQRKPATLKMIRTEQPDLIGVQEALIGQVQFIEQHCPQYTRLGVARDDGAEQGELMALFYLTERFDCLADGNFWLSQTPDSVSRGWDAACNRMVTWGAFRDRKSGREVYCFNTHLDHMGAEAREQSIRLIAARIGELVPEGAAVVLSGDFNSSSDDAIFRPLDALLHNARETSPVTDHRTTFTAYGEITAPLLLDHIFFTQLRPLSFRTLDSDYGVPYISDHYPIEAVLGL